MTLAVGVVVSDGVVVAADSRTSRKLGDDAPFRVLSDYTHKVFRVKDVAIATHGYAFLLGRNIAGHMSEFSVQFEVESTASAVAESLSVFFEAGFAAHLAAYPGDKPADGVTALGFLVGGFDGGVGCLYEVSVPIGQVTKVGDSTTGTAAWRGQTDVMARILKGVDLDQLVHNATSKGLLDHVGALGEAWPMMEYVTQFNVMNVQDACQMAVNRAVTAQTAGHTVSRGPAWKGIWRDRTGRSWYVEACIEQAPKVSSGPAEGF